MTHSSVRRRSLLPILFPVLSLFRLYRTLLVTWPREFVALSELLSTFVKLLGQLRSFRRGCSSHLGILNVLCRRMPCHSIFDSSLLTVVPCLLPVHLGLMTFVVFPHLSITTVISLCPTLCRLLRGGRTVFSLLATLKRSLPHRIISSSFGHFVLGAILFATCLNAKLPLYCSLVPDPQAVFEDAFRHPWDDLDLYAFPPFALVGRVIARVQQSSRVVMTLVAPLWPEKEWFADLLLLLTQPPLALPCWDKLLRQPHCSLFHQGVHALKLHAWRLSSDTTESRAFREELLESCQGSSESPPLDCTSRDGGSSVVGVVEGALLQSTPLFL